MRCEPGMKVERSALMEEYEAQSGRRATEEAEGCEFAREEYVVWLQIRLEVAREHIKILERWARDHRC